MPCYLHPHLTSDKRPSHYCYLSYVMNTNCALLRTGRWRNSLVADEANCVMVGQDFQYYQYDDDHEDDDNIARAISRELAHAFYKNSMSSKYKGRHSSAAAVESIYSKPKAVP